MAYNPFNIFRRNQKALFAVLTVFIMIMFTLSFGQNDIFDRLSRWIGKGKGEALCKIDGSSVKDREISQVRRNRVVANTFMTLASQETAGALARYTDQQRGKLSEDGQRMALYAQIATSSPPMDQRSAQFWFQARGEIQKIMDNPNAKTEDKDAARAYQAQLDLFERRFTGAEIGGYFLNAPNRNTRDTIEFMLWEKKADQLGIRFTRNDVNALITREFYGYFKSDVEVRKALQKQMEGFTMDSCLDALAVEFKVRAAQAAVLGPSGKLGPGAPVYGTPYEMFEFYRQQCSPAKYELIPVPAQAFIEKVPGEPSETELKALYDKFANDEPNPGKESFGFKEPRKLSVQWLAITGEEPYYQKLAAEQVRVGEVMAKASGLTAVPVPGVGGGWASVAAAPLAIKEPAVDAAYAAAVSQFKSQVQNEYSSSLLFFPRDVLAPNVVRPATPVAALAGLMGQTAPFGSPIQAASLAHGAPIAYEVQSRTKFGLPLVVGLVPGPGLMGTVVGGAAGSRAAELQPLPIGALRPELMKTTLGKRAKDLAHGSRPSRFDPDTPVEKGDIARFTEELAKLSEQGRAKDKGAVEKYIAEFKAARGLTKAGEQFGATTMPRDEWTLEEDPGVRPLVLAQKESLMFARGAHGSNRYVPFGRSFFWKPQQTQTRTPTSGTYAATAYPPEDRGSFGDESRPRYVVWTTEDVQPKKTSFIAAKEAVRAAWKQQKARELAQQRAQAIADAIGKEAASSAETLRLVVREQVDRLRNDIPAGNKALLRANSFTLDNVCPQVPLDPEIIQQMLMQGMNFNGRMQPFGLSETQNTPYPTREMATQLIENRDKPFKTTLVLSDAPKDTYYVAVLARPSNDVTAQKTVADFKNQVYAPTGQARKVFTDFIQDEARKSRESVVALLKKEFRYEETPEQAKKLDDKSSRD